LGNSNTIARHFANFVNAIFDGAWASAPGSVLTITSHSFSSVWQRENLETQIMARANESVQVKEGCEHEVAPL
jgi:hypothetical protein